jgi:hypothetical protein
MTNRYRMPKVYTLWLTGDLKVVDRVLAEHGFPPLVTERDGYVIEPEKDPPRGRCIYINAWSDESDVQAQAAMQKLIEGKHVTATVGDLWNEGHRPRVSERLGYEATQPGAPVTIDEVKGDPDAD